MRTNQMKRSHLLFAAAIGFGAVMIASPGSVSAKISSGACVTCHTMHDSQDGAVVATGGPNNVLLRYNCLGCHTGTNGADGLNANSAPGVLDTVPPTFWTGGNTTLAGGNFYWVEQGVDAKGHNLTEMTGNPVDVPLAAIPPGGLDLATFAAGANVATLTCAGATGCHGDRGLGGFGSTDVDTQDFGGIGTAHHGNDNTIDGSSVFASYRFLLGVRGLEDSTWQYTTTTTKHNEYYGSARTDDSDVGGTAGGADLTISGLCATCHNDFHNDGLAGAAFATPGIENVGGVWGNPWVRHPTDLDFNGLGGQYASYTVYDVQTPIGRSTIPASASAAVYGGESIVICMSCHVAHGSPYDDLLRWNYATMVAGQGVGTDGCFNCHTTK